MTGGPYPFRPRRTDPPRDATSTRVQASLSRSVAPTPLRHSPKEVPPMRLALLVRLVVIVLAAGAASARAGEPDPKTYCDVDDIRPGMKGTGRTVMVGTKLEDFEAE